MYTFLFSTYVFIFGFFFSVSTVHAQTLNISPVKAYFTEESMSIGYTLTTSGDECRLGVRANAFGEETNEAVVVLRHIKKRRMKSTLQNEISLSPLFKYRVKEPAQLTAPLWISIAWRKTTEKSYVLKQWNEEEQMWELLDSTVDQENGRVQAQVSAQSGIVGVFEAESESVPEDDDVFTGKASWFSGNSIHGYGSAMNIFPIGTRVLVTNIANNKQVETTIVSTGPFVPGRIIDLSLSAFNTISHSSVGVIDVIVEEIKE